MPLVQEMLFKIFFLSGALGALLFSGAEPFTQFLKEDIMGNIHYMWSYTKFGPVVEEEMLFREKVFGRTHNGQKPITIAHLWAFGSGELKNRRNMGKTAARDPGFPERGFNLLILQVMYRQIPYIRQLHTSAIFVVYSVISRNLECAEEWPWEFFNESVNTARKGWSCQNEAQTVKYSIFNFR